MILRKFQLQPLMRAAHRAAVGRKRLLIRTLVTARPLAVTSPALADAPTSAPDATSST